MIIPQLINRIAKYIVILILVASFIFALWWLWQRQPTPKLDQVSEIFQKNQQPGKNGSQLNPKDTSVLKSQNVKVEGKITPSAFVAIYAPSFNYITKSDTDGQFTQNIALAKGLNLISVTAISSDLKETQKSSITYFLSDEKEKATAVFAGSVKTIFDTLLTITTSAGDQKIQIAKNTQIAIPSDNEESTKSALANVRIGDFAIALGKLLQDTLNAASLEIIRENKPQNIKEVLGANIATSVKANTISVKPVNGDEILKLTITKESRIENNGQEAKTADITKDKIAIIIYHEVNNKNLVDLIFLLP